MDSRPWPEGHGGPRAFWPRSDVLLRRTRPCRGTAVGFDRISWTRGMASPSRSAAVEVPSAHSGDDVPVTVPLADTWSRTVPSGFDPMIALRTERPKLASEAIQHAGEGAPNGISSTRKFGTH